MCGGSGGLSPAHGEYREISSGLRSIVFPSLPRRCPNFGDDYGSVPRSAPSLCFLIYLRLQNIFLQQQPFRRSIDKDEARAVSLRQTTRPRGAN